MKLAYERLSRTGRTGREVTVDADYLIIADGANGTTRAALGIGRHGAGVLQHWMNIIFDTDMSSGDYPSEFFPELLQFYYSPHFPSRTLQLRRGRLF